MSDIPLTSTYPLAEMNSGFLFLSVSDSLSSISSTASSSRRSSLYTRLEDKEDGDSFFVTSTSSSSLATSISSSPSSPVIKEINLDIEPLDLNNHNNSHVTPTPLCDQCDLRHTYIPLQVEYTEKDNIKGGNMKIISMKKDLVSLIKPLVQKASYRAGRKVKIVGLLASSNEGCGMYANMTEKQISEVEVEFVKIDMKGNTEEEVSEKVKEINEDLTVDGLLFYTPCFGEGDQRIRNLISERIDIEGYHSTYLEESRSVPPSPLSEIEELDQFPIYPCTPLAVVQSLQSTTGLYDLSAPAGQRLVGKIITIINRSETVGLPLIAMLANEGALVFSKDIDSLQIWSKSLSSDRPCISTSTISLPHHLSISDIVISAVPSSAYKIPTQYLKPGCIAINVSTEMNFEEKVTERAQSYAARMGSLTIMMLVLNGLALRARSIKH